MRDRITAEQWHRVGALFDVLVCLPPDQRSARLERETGGDAGLREQLESLLRHAGEEPDRLDGNAVDLVARPCAAAAGLAIGSRVGAYRLLELVGRGGMGEVYRAERADGQFEQQVALKLIRADTIATPERFQAERSILARLEHPGIARLYDGGVHHDGRPYMVMEWVSGTSITQACEAHGAGLAQRLALFEQVCEAVAYAHRNLLVHRDLKPANVLVTDGGQAKLLDFGVAKLLTSAPAEQTQGAPLTPAYAAPEQWRNENVTTATDVYALGLLLFELLGGTRPWPRQTGAIAQLLDQQLRSIAPSLSSVTAAQPQPPVPPKLLRGDLDAIVARCLRAEPEQRYESVAALQADLQRYRHGEPVAARRGVRGYVAVRLLRRHRWAVAASLALLLALVGGLVAVGWQAQRTQVQAQRAEAVQGFLVDLFRSNSSSQADPVQARETTARELLDKGAVRIDTAMDQSPQAKLALLQLFGQLYDELDLAESAVDMRRRAADLAHAVHGADSAAHATALIDLAGSMASTAATADTRRATLDQAAAILDRQGDHSSVLRARLLRKYAEFHSNTDAPTALAYARQAVDLLERLPPTVDLAESLARLGNEAQGGGDLPLAVDAFRRAVLVSQRVQGDPNPDLARYYGYYGEAQYRMLDVQGGERSARRGVELALQLHGADSVYALQARTRLGKLLFNTGRTQEGLAQLQAARDLALRLKGADDPHHTPQARLLAGYALAVAGRPAEGLVEMEAAIASARRFRPGDIYLATMLETAAERALIDLGRLGQARAYLDEALQIRERAGQPAGGTARSANTRARILLALRQQRADEAAALLAELPEGDAPLSFGRLDHDVLAAEIALAKQRPHAAQRAGELRARIEASPLAAYLPAYLARAHMVLGTVGLQQADRPSAQSHFERALQLREAIFLEESPRLAETRQALRLAQQR